MASFFEGMGFAKKAELAFKLLAISQPLYSQIVKVNKIRNDFAHPRNRGYKKYRKRKEYSEALKSLIAATQQLRDLVIVTDDTGFKTQD